MDTPQSRIGNGKSAIRTYSRLNWDVISNFSRTQAVSEMRPYRFIPPGIKHYPQNATLPGELFQHVVPYYFIICRLAERSAWLKISYRHKAAVNSKELSPGELAG